MVLACPSLTGRPLSGIEVCDDLRAVENDHATPMELQHDRRLLDELARDMDIIVTIDTPYPLETDLPIVLWLNNFSYGPESRSVFALNWDVVIVPSPYARRCVEWYFGPASWSGPPRPILSVPYGVPVPNDADPVELASLRRALGVPDGARCLVFPHRCDPHKGFDVALAATLELRRRGAERLLLVPCPPVADLYSHQRGEAAHRRCSAAATGAAHLHRWLAPSEMPVYLQLAEWALCPSELDESFFLSPLESVAAGVPAIATPAGALPDVLPPNHGIELVDFEDHMAVADVIAAGPDADSVERGRAWIAQRLTWGAAAQTWIEVLAAIEKSRSRFTPVAPTDAPTAPWRRRLASGRTWHHVRRAYADEVVS